MAHLKKKEFLAKAKDLKELSGEEVWVCVNQTSDGQLIGWIVGITNSDEDQQVLITDKGTLRNFKTVDAAVSFVADNYLCNGAVSVAYT